MLAEQPDIVAKVKTTLLAMGDDHSGRTILGDLYNIDSLVEGKDADYEPVREAFAAVRNR